MNAIIIFCMFFNRIKSLQGNTGIQIFYFIFVLHYWILHQRMKHQYKI